MSQKLCIYKYIQKKIKNLSCPSKGAFYVKMKQKLTIQEYPGTALSSQPSLFA
jgi:hypothetical protein